MSVSTEHTVWCDECSHWIQVSGRARAALKEAKRQGWKRTHTGGVVRDLCPRCQGEKP